MKVIPFILMKEGSLILSDGSSISNPLDYCRTLSGSGADTLFFLELMGSEEGHHRNLELLKELSHGGTGSFIAGGLCSHIDDVKKYLYSGADSMCFAGRIPEKLLADCLERFKEKRVSIAPENGEEARKAYAMGVRRFFCVLGNQEEILAALEGCRDARVFGPDNVESVM
ncbi:MAG: HisA/HisF-related TIM barrel protein, partial [Lachnospiraceae bacterium]